MNRRRLFVPAAVLGLLLVVAAAVGSTFGGGDSAARPPAGGYEDTVAKALPSVVQIQGGGALGAGIVLDDAGHVVTNAHVVADSQRFRVTAADGTRYAATLRGKFPQGDLAVIDVDVEPGRLRPAEFADSSEVEVGEVALAIGSPLGLRSSVTQGIVSSTGRTVGEGNGVALPSAIQTSAPINPGNSGGALVDENGAVIGVPTLAANFGGAPAPGIGFAISSNTVRSIARQLAEHGRVAESSRAWLGVGLQSMPLGGVIVASVSRGGPAADAGISVGDVIVSVEGEPVPTVDDVAVALASHAPGDRIDVVLRDRRGTRTVSVTLAELPPAAQG